MSKPTKIGSCTQSGDANKKRNKNASIVKLLLVYPFDVDEELFREASVDLLELGGNLLGVQEDDPSVDDQLGEEDITEGAAPSRTHYVTR